ncbi:MAG: ClpXP protease specificity-enhancing factor, partial [Shewanella sp.]
GTVFDIEDAYLMDEEVGSPLAVVETTTTAFEPTDEPPKRRSHLTVVK